MSFPIRFRKLTTREFRPITTFGTLSVIVFAAFSCFDLPVSPSKKFSVIEWKQARQNHNYSVLEAMSADLKTKVIGMKQTECLDMLGTPDKKGYLYGTIDRQVAFYDLEPPGKESKTIEIVFKDSNVTEANIQPTLAGRLIIRALCL